MFVKDLVGVAQISKKYHLSKETPLDLINLTDLSFNVLPHQLSLANIKPPVEYTV